MENGVHFRHIYLPIISLVILLTIATVSIRMQAINYFSINITDLEGGYRILTHNYKK